MHGPKSTFGSTVRQGFLVTVQGGYWHARGMGTECVQYVTEGA